MRAVLREMRETGTRVFVAGRADANGVFCTLGKDLRVVDDAEGMLIEIDEGACRVDVSSTSIRAAEAAAHKASARPLQQLLLQLWAQRCTAPLPALWPH